MIPELADIARDRDNERNYPAWRCAGCSKWEGPLNPYMTMDPAHPFFCRGCAWKVDAIRVHEHGYEPRIAATIGAFRCIHRHLTEQEARACAYDFAEMLREEGR